MDVKLVKLSQMEAQNLKDILLFGGTGQEYQN